MVRATIMTWQGGGATQPAIGLGRLLAERGAEVRILAPAAYAERVAAADCIHRPLPPGLEFDPGAGRAAEDQESYIDEIVLGLGPAQGLADELAENPADVVLLDYLMRSTITRAESLGVPRVLFFHMAHRFHGSPRGGDEQWGWRWQYRMVNELREGWGLEPLPVGPETLAITLARRAGGAIVAMPREFDPWPEGLPPGVVHVGPVFEEVEAPRWDPPWPGADRRPLAVVTMGSTYMHQEEVLTRIATVLAELGMRVLVLTGYELGAEELDLDGDVAVRDFVPHSAVFPGADLVVTHAGIGTLMAAFAAAVPLLCLPLGRDQGLNAERVAEMGVGLALPPDAPPEQIREAASTVLGSEQMNAAARELATAVAGYDTPRLVAEVIEGAIR